MTDPPIAEFRPPPSNPVAGTVANFLFGLYVAAVVAVSMAAFGFSPFRGDPVGITVTAMVSAASWGWAAWRDYSRSAVVRIYDPFLRVSKGRREIVFPFDRALEVTIRFNPYGEPRHILLKHPKGRALLRSPLSVPEILQSLKPRIGERVVPDLEQGLASGASLSFPLSPLRRYVWLLIFAALAALSIFAVGWTVTASIQKRSFDGCCLLVCMAWLIGIVSTAYMLFRYSGGRGLEVTSEGVRPLESGAILFPWSAIGEIRIQGLGLEVLTPDQKVIASFPADGRNFILLAALLERIRDARLGR